MTKISTSFKSRVFLCCGVFACSALFVQAKETYQGISAQNVTGSRAISSEGLVASYNFEDYTHTGLLKDFSVFANNGKLEQEYNRQGTFGHAREFSKKEDVVLLPDNGSLNLAGPLTIAAKLKITTPNLHQHMFVCTDMFVLWLNKENQYVFADTHGKGMTTESVQAVADKSWHSVVATLSVGVNGVINKDNMKVFVDGAELKGSYRSPWTPTQLPPVNACVIGGDRNGHQHHQDLQFEGLLDELQVYSRVWTDDEINSFSE